jgi:hypothetical protein
MIADPKPLYQVFHTIIADTYEHQLGLADPRVNNYVANVLTSFAQTDRLYRLHDEEGHPIRNLEGMLAASDPIHGTAPSFDAEREARRHIGDYALFFTGMYPEAMRQRSVPTNFSELVETGKESYYIVSLFDLFEYAEEAPLFARLSDWFERCVYGLTLVREELSRRDPNLLPPTVN